MAMPLKHLKHLCISHQMYETSIVFSICCNMSWEYNDMELQLWAALQTGESILIKQLIYDNVDINITDRNGNTLLHTAAKYRKDDAVKELIEAGVDVNAQNNNGQTALHLAADRGHAYTVLLLLENGCAYNTKTKFSEMTALHLASRFGHHHVVRLLVDAGADIDAADSIGKPPDFYAATEEVRKIFHNLKERTCLHRNISSQPKANDSNISAIKSNQVNALTTANQKSHGSSDNSKIRNPSQSTKNTKAVVPKSRNVNHRIRFSDNHQMHMKKNVFDRLASNKNK